MRPRMAASYEEADLVRQAALLAVGIAQAQAFLDGNKRTAYQATDVFLWINGLKLVGDPLALAQQLEEVAERSYDPHRATNDVESRLRTNVLPRS
jgi:death-on-curing protein